MTLCVLPRCGLLSVPGLRVSGITMIMLPLSPCMLMVVLLV